MHPHEMILTQRPRDAEAPRVWSGVRMDCRKAASPAVTAPWFFLCAFAAVRLCVTTRPELRKTSHGSILLLSILVPALVQGADFEIATNDSIVFVQIPAGTFTMGSTEEQRAALIAQKAWTRFENCELPAHAVTITKPFLIGQCEVTQKQWETVMGKNPSAFKGENLPVESVSWEDVQAFLKKLNEKGGGKYRLPTEAEWEYCCWAGSTNFYGLGKEGALVTTNNLAQSAWYRANAENKTHEVGRKFPNAWGLYDLHGNVWEWCQDWYAADYYARSPRTDPLNTAPSTERVMRGGSWFLEAPNLRAAFRSGNLPGFKSQYVGFRLARDL